MKAWILIAFYLLRDIWRRWFETPGAVFARVLVAAMLCLFMLLLQATFELAIRSIESRILKMGVQNVFVRVNISMDDVEAGFGGLDASMSPLGDLGDVATFKAPFARVETEYGTSATLLAYPDTALAELGDFLASPLARAGEGRYLLTSSLPAGVPVQATVNGIALAVETLELPERFDAIGSQRDILLVPEASVPYLLNGRSRIEFVLFSANEGVDIATVVKGLRAMLTADGFQHFTIQSAERWLDELANLKERQQRWQLGATLASGLILVAVFGSISILEYRQNRFIVALIRSFGTPPAMLFCRYLIEGVALAAIGAGIAFATARAIHKPVFQLAGIEGIWLNLDRFDPYQWQNHELLFATLAVGALAGLAPILVALRQPVGKILS